MDEDIEVESEEKNDGHNHDGDDLQSHKNSEILVADASVETQDVVDGSAGAGEAENKEQDMHEDIDVESEEENEVFFKEDIKKLQLLFDKQRADSDLRMLTTSVDKREKDCVEKKEKDYVEKKKKGSKTLCVLMKRYHGPPVTRLCYDKKNLNLDEVNTRNDSGGKVFQRKAKRTRVMTRGMKKKMDEDFVDDEDGRRKVKKKRN